MTRTLVWWEDEEWFVPNSVLPDAVFQGEMSEEGFALWTAWYRTDINADHDVSGVLADWWEEHMPPTPESVRFVAKLREWFHSRKGVAT